MFKLMLIVLMSTMAVSQVREVASPADLPTDSGSIKALEGSRVGFEWLGDGERVVFEINPTILGEGSVVDRSSAPTEVVAQVGSKIALPDSPTTKVPAAAKTVKVFVFEEVILSQKRDGKSVSSLVAVNRHQLTTKPDFAAIKAAIASKDLAQIRESWIKVGEKGRALSVSRMMDETTEKWQIVHILGTGRIGAELLLNGVQALASFNTPTGTLNGVAALLEPAMNKPIKAAVAAGSGFPAAAMEAKIGVGTNTMFTPKTAFPVTDRFDRVCSTVSFVLAAS